MPRARLRFAGVAGVIVSVVLVARCSGCWGQFQDWVWGSKAVIVATESPLNSTHQDVFVEGEAVPLAPAHAKSEWVKPAEPQPPVPASAKIDSTLEPTTYSFPAAFMELVQLVVSETNNGNHTTAALAALDAIEISREYPQKHEFLHQLAGLNYEQVGLIDFAIEQYRLALALNPEQRSSYDGLRRLDPDFQASHPALPDPIKAVTEAAQVQSR